MALTSGFFNSNNHDRTYDAIQFGEMFDGVINDGIFTTVGNAFGVRPGSGLQVVVRSGRAWFNGTWTLNTGDYPLDLEVSDLLLPRIDAIVLDVDKTRNVRDNSFKVITGYPDTNPTKPTVTKDETAGHFQYPLAYVTVPANAIDISASNIEGYIGSEECPHANALLNMISIEGAWEQWEGQFEDWFDKLEHIGSSDQLVQVAILLLNLKPRVEDLRTKTATAQAALDEIKRHL